MGPTILHADLDAFYASVEQLLDPSLRGRPIAVGGGVVLAASYEAKRWGVQGGMAGWKAKRLCPELRFVRGHFSEYQRLADRVMAIFDDVTPLVERVSIDEAFLDVAGASHLFGAPAEIAAHIRRRVRSEVGLPISIGAARTKHLAKIASQVAKPDGLCVVPPHDERAFLDPLPVGLVWGIGPVTQQRLASRGILTIGDLAASRSAELRSLLGTALGAKASALAANDDARIVRPRRRVGSVGAQSSFGRHDPSPELVRAVLGHLADRVATRLRAKQRAGRTVTARVRFGDMSAVTRSHTGRDPVSSTLTLTEVSERLVLGALGDHREQSHISQLAIAVSNLVDRPALQLQLPLEPEVSPDEPGAPRGAARWAVERSVDAVRTRFGRAAVGYGGVVFGGVETVPDEFRELAEHSS